MIEKWEEVLCNENDYKLILERCKFINEEKDVIQVEFIEKNKNEEEIVINKEKLIHIMKKFVRAYLRHKEASSLDDWLVEMLRKEFPNKNLEILKKEAKELIMGVNIGKKKYEEIEEKRKMGISPSNFLGKNIANTTKGSSVQEVKEDLKSTNEILKRRNLSEIYKNANGIEIAPGIVGFNKMTKYFDNINETIAIGNEKMIESLLTKNGTINQNPQLDGFIFEQFHENTFNIDAALKDVTNVRAEALVPKAGTGYGKNSVDLVVKIQNGNAEKIIKKYQAKLSDNPEKLFKKGNYKFQRKLYGEGHPKVGNTKVEYENISSQSMSKSQGKVVQSEVQKGNLDAAKQNFKNDVDVKMLSKQVAKQALTSGTIAFGLGMALSAGYKLIQGEKLKSEEVVLDGLKVGANAGIATAIAGGIKIAVEKEIITGKAAKILKNNSVVGTIAFSVISLIAIAGSVGNGDISVREGLKESGSVLAATYGGINGSLAGVSLASGIIASVGVILAPVIAIVAGTIGYFVGSNIGKVIVKGAIEISSAVVSGVKNLITTTYESVKDTIVNEWNTLKRGVKSFGEGVINGFQKISSGICDFLGFNILVKGYKGDKIENKFTKIFKG